jgi:uncharacterized damage-inducible protein DinB
VHPLTSAILITWRRNSAYALRLVADLTDEQFTAQPIRGRALNHPAWVLSHLNVYAPICAAMLRGEAFEDPIEHRYGQNSEVSADPVAYRDRETLTAAYHGVHDDVEQALLAAPPEVFAAPTPLARWRTVHPTIGDMLVTLMVKHESGHLGQLSAWRRAMGLPRVSM